MNDNIVSGICTRVIDHIIDHCNSPKYKFTLHPYQHLQLFLIVAIGYVYHIFQLTWSSHVSTNASHDCCRRR